jgi:hypothetical protein
MYPIAFWQCLSPIPLFLHKLQEKKRGHQALRQFMFPTLQMDTYLSSLYDIQLAVQVCFENSMSFKIA